jgi:iron complex outermembrane receptor protein
MALPVPASARAGGGVDAPTEEERSADEEIEDLVGPTHRETMVVTASRREESLLDAPVSITVVGTQQVETSAADNVADLLRGVPGLNATQTSARQLSVTTRTSAGALANSQLVLLDGRSIYQDFFGLVMWDVLPVQSDEIRQVEVLRGPGSAVWGANALSGVVNVRTKSPRELEGGLAWARAGERGTRAGGVRWAQSGSKWSWKLSGSWYEQDPWERENTFADGTPIPPAFDFANEGTEQPKIDLRVDREVDGRMQSFGLGHGGTSGIMHTGIGPFRIDDSSSMRHASWERAGSAWEAKVYLNVLDGEALNLLNGLEFLFETRTLVAETSRRRSIGERHELTWGSNARLNRFDLSLAPGEDSRAEVGAFVEDRLRVADRWTLHAGLRLDWHEAVAWVASPRTSLVFRPREGQAVHLAWDRAFRAPSLVNNHLDTAVPNVAVLPNGNQFVFVTFAEGDEDLDEESADAVELGWTGSLGRSVVSAVAYRNVTRDLIDFAPAEYYGPDDPPSGLPPGQVPERELVKTFRYRNVGKVVNEGLELSVDTWWSRRLQATASYTWQGGTDVTEDDPEEPLVENQPPRHQLAGSVSWQGPRYSAAFSASWTDEAYWADVLDDRFWGRTDPYWLLSASFAARFDRGRLELRLTGTNLLDEPVKQHVFGDVVRRKLAAELRCRF